MGDLEIIVFTNENHMDILNITLPRFIEYLNPINRKINVVTNKLVNNTNINFDDVNVIETNVNFDSQGGHFRESMLLTLNSISSDYILFFCDDYMINSIVKVDVFENVMNIIKNYDCDFLSFVSLAYCRHDLLKWSIINPNLNEYGINDGVLYEINDDYRHLYSVQPCIWKRTSLIELLEHNDTLTLHMLDNTMIKNKKGLSRPLNYETYYYESNDTTKLDYGFKNYTIDLPPLNYNIDDRVIGSDYFVFDYGEIMRHGHIINFETNTVRILNEYLNQNPKVKEKVVKFL